MDLKQLWTTLLFFFYTFYSSNATPNMECSEHTLLLLNIVFRHGNKTQEGTYPTDPHQKETYYPVGKGELTSHGKLMGYRTGSYLRKKYANFLGTYKKGILEAYSSPSPRCKVYLQLILASLYPPSGIDKWHPELNWQPIAINENCTLSKDLFWVFASCPNFLKGCQQYKQSEQYSKIMGPYKKTMKYIEDASGITGEKNVYGAAIQLHATFLAQQDWNLSLPVWAEKIWPDELEKLAAMEWTQLFGTEDTRIMGAGFLMSKIINDIYLKINQDPSAEGRKIYLYVGHDTNIYGTLAWLNVLSPKIAPYGSYIILELHNIGNEHYIKILYQNQPDNHSEPVPINIPDCGYCCSIKDFVNLYSSQLHPEKICY